MIEPVTRPAPPQAPLTGLALFQGQSDVKQLHFWGNYCNWEVTIPLQKMAWGLMGNFSRDANQPSYSPPVRDTECMPATAPSLPGAGEDCVWSCVSEWEKLAHAWGGGGGIKTFPTVRWGGQHSPTEATESGSRKKAEPRVRQRAQKRHVYQGRWMDRRLRGMLGGWGRGRWKWL